MFELKGLRNPRTTLTTDKFFLTTLDSDLASTIDSGYDLATKMTIEATLAAFDAAPSNVTNGADNTYTFSMDPGSLPLLDGDRLSFTMPDQITVPSQSAELACRPVEGLEKITCSVSGRSLTIVLDEVSQATGTFKWTLAHIKNPPTLERSDKFTAISVTDKDGYGVAWYDGELTEGILNEEAALLQPPYNLTQEHFQNSTLAEYAIAFTPWNAIPSTGSIVLSWPAQVTVEVETAACRVTTSREFAFNGTTDGEAECRVEPAATTAAGTAGGTVTIKGVFEGQEQFHQQVTIKLAVTNPKNNLPGTRGFGIRTYADAESRYVIDYLPDNIDSTNEYHLVPRLECNHPCATCTASDPDLCESCWQDDLESPPFLMRYYYDKDGQKTTDADKATTQRGQCKADCDLGFT